MKKINLIGIFFFLILCSTNTIAAKTASDVLEAFASDLRDNEAFKWIKFDQRQQVAVPQIQNSLTLYDFKDVERNEDWTLFEGDEPGVERKNIEYAPAYKLTAEFADGAYLYLIQYELEPKCGNCLKRLDDAKRAIANAKNPSDFTEATLWGTISERLSSLSWTTTIGTGLSLAFAVQYYRTGSPFMAAVSVASLGLLFVCPCNGRVKLGLCPQKVTVAASALLALMGMNQARQRQN